MSRFIRSAILALILCSVSSSSFAQKIRICIDFDNPDPYLNSKGQSTQNLPSGLSAAQQAAIIAQVQSIYERVVGKGNVEVKDAKGGNCDSSVLVIVSGDTGRGDEYGDAHIDYKVAVVHLGQLLADGFKGDTLRAGVGECVAHEAAHLIIKCEGHNRDTASIFCPGNKISVQRRMQDHRGFTVKDSIKINQVLAVALGPSIPQRGVFAVSSPTHYDVKVDESYTDLHLLSYGYGGATTGYLSTEGTFIGGSGLFQDNGITAIGNQSFNFATKWGSSVYDLTNYGKVRVADPVSTNLFKQVMLQFGNGYSNGYSFMSVESPTSLSGIFPNYGNWMETDAPEGGSTMFTDYLDEFQIYVCPKMLIVDDGYASTDDVYWYPPEGTEILDAEIEDEYRSYVTGDDIAIYAVLLNDGSVVELEFRTHGHFPNIETTIDELDETPPNPFSSPNGLADLVDGPFTTRFGGFVSRYLSSSKTWVPDTTGIGNQTTSIVSDTNHRVYAAAAGIYVQPDTALTWTKLTNYPATYTNKLFVDRKQRIFAATYSAVYMSTDHGQTWSVDTIGISKAGFVSTFGGDKLGNVYAIAGNYNTKPHLYKSLGGTGPWVEIGTPVGAMLVDPQAGQAFTSISGDSTTLYLSTKVGLFSSSDQGTTWTAHNQHIRTTGYYSIAENSQHQLFLGTDAGLFSGAYHATNWTKAFPAYGYMTMSQRPLFVDNQDNLYTLGVHIPTPSFGYAIARSTDGGATWTQDSTGAAIVKNGGRYFVDPNGKEWIAAAGNQTAIYSKPKGGSWGLDQTGFVPRPNYEYVTTFFSDGTATYIASTYSTASGQSSMIWKYSSGTWTVDTTGIRDAQVYTLCKDKFGNLFAGAADRILMFKNNAWQEMNLPAPHANNIYYTACDATGALYATFYNQAASGNYIGAGVYFTLDQGATWTRSDVPDTLELDGLYAHADTVYLTTTQGVMALTSNRFATSFIPEGAHTGLTTAIDFGNVKTNTTAQMPIRITNFGNMKLQVTSVSSTDPAFTLMGVPGSADASMVLPATVQFKPTAVKSYQATLVLSSNSMSGFDTILVTGAGSTTGAVLEASTPQITLLQNYPNPSHGVTTIGYVLPNRVRVTLKITDELGRVIQTLVSGEEDAGMYLARCDISHYASGVYYYTLESGTFRQTRSFTVDR